MRRKLNRVEDKSHIFFFTDNVLRYIFLSNATYHEAADRCSNISAKIFNPRDYNPGLLSKLLKLRKTETIWTEIFREFIWRKLNGIYPDLDLMWLTDRNIV